jgi:hypothetical protein
MEHRKVDVSDFADRVYGELKTWNDWDDQEELKFDDWFQLESTEFPPIS